ncbi:succinyl-diaminopimelate desuccinylase [Sulfolobus sp. A20]|uniref:M20 family metallopeptidase n=1 Tax=Sulfolobaceae TaxID=118883 RepID=UPI000845CDE4|nr:MULTISPECIES: M20 family metallopeptidase [unclassified Sulfolobus]TRM74593.1 succinyl-diaminopimelate desuccinylase [Sulfolobus sp. A20-N-F8]TRM75357.1 succinyl-diaminopimelate desuccinylase [Sulfolobus sp. B5]TRM80194.1 succinyl-diaminopimelate desuccinylase [Sulfolobus sp. D5]TRM83087.1 succinyl-diaminopimelate desuccinylase [Sulfolobus sp. A20-N-F6]TRM84551.1 succinyl-diaminopimelate desuccinylase [Sulfolobus sp. F3]TRM87310.1 succinyl-diaminopimelate desuccinylase [Sulfolobus sp. E3]
MKTLEVKILEDLVSFRTVNPPGREYDRMASYLKDLLENIGFKVELIEIPEEFLEKHYIYSPLHRGHKRVIIYARNDENPILHFNAHYDVVPPGNGWESDPFKMKVVNGVAYGRGVSDMKGGIVSIYQALSINNDIPMEISFVPDEESGGIGSKFLTENRGIRAKYTIIAEPSFPNIYVGHYGIIRGLIKVKGKQVHASMSHEGKNAFILASKLALTIDEEYRKVIKSKEVKDFPLSLNLGGYTINSSESDGIVPGEFSFSFYRTTLPNEENVEEEIKETVRDIAKRLNVEYEMNVKSFVKGYELNKDSKLVKLAEDCVLRKIGVNPQKLVSAIRFDAIFFSKFSEVINIGPGKEAHNPNESIELKNIHKVSEIYECIMNDLRNET